MTPAEVSAKQMLFIFSAIVIDNNLNTISFFSSLFLNPLAQMQILNNFKNMLIQNMTFIQQKFWVYSENYHLNWKWLFCKRFRLPNILWPYRVNSDLVWMWMKYKVKSLDTEYITQLRTHLVCSSQSASVAM